MSRVDEILDEFYEHAVELDQRNSQAKSSLKLLLIEMVGPEIELGVDSAQRMMDTGYYYESGYNTHRTKMLEAIEAEFGTTPTRKEK